MKEIDLFPKPEHLISAQAFIDWVNDELVGRHSAIDIFASNSTSGAMNTLDQLSKVLADDGDRKSAEKFSSVANIVDASSATMTCVLVNLSSSSSLLLKDPVSELQAKMAELGGEEQEGMNNGEIRDATNEEGDVQYQTSIHTRFGEENKSKI